MIATIKDLEEFSNTYHIPMLFEENLPAAFSIIIYQRDEAFVKAWINEHRAVHILIYYRVLENRLRNDKQGLIEGMK